MPTYLTPGVYVEEVPSANKPIEGVGTAVAAFVGLAPGGPINKPMRISNWTQFAKIYGDPQHPENGPFMEGAYLAHAVYGYFQNGGIARAGSSASAPSGGDAGGAGRAARRHRQGRRGAARGRARRRQRPGQGRDHRGAAAARARTQRPDLQGRRQRRAPRARSTRASRCKKGRNNVATKVNAASKLIKIEETGAALPEAQRVGRRAATRCRCRRSRVEKVKPTTSRATSPRRKGMGSVAALDEVTMLVMPDIVSLNGDGAQMRDLQGKMIAHCEN